jgi:hypothetical protein
MLAPDVTESARSLNIFQTAILMEIDVVNESRHVFVLDLLIERA